MALATGPVGWSGGLNAISHSEPGTGPFGLKATSPRRGGVAGPSGLPPLRVVQAGFQRRRP